MASSDWLIHVLYFVCSGWAFFSGVAFIFASLAGSPFVRGRVPSLARNLAAVIGWFLVAISAAPLEWWLYGLAVGATLFWLLVEWRSEWFTQKSLEIYCRFGGFAVWMLVLGLELPYHLVSVLSSMNQPRLLLIGDSISAGMSESEKGTRPKLFASQHAVKMHDCSKMGATVKSARKQAEILGDETGLVLMEIGGNDLLGGTSAGQFEEQLDLLLSEVCRPKRLVVMLALPLPPLMNSFGVTQRRLAHKHGVYLIPPHILAGVLLAPGATLDGIHLTPEGHQKMADAMWKVVAPAYR